MQYGVPHNKGNQFSAICNYMSDWGRAAEPIAEKRLWGV